MSDSFAIPWTITCQVLLSLGFPRQEYWSGFHFLLQGIFLTQGSKLHLLHWQVDSLPLSHLGSLFNSVQSLSHVQLFATLWTAACQASLSITNSQSLLKLMSNSCPLSRWCHPSVSPSVVPFSLCLQSFPASGSSPASQFFISHQIAKVLESQLQHQSFKWTFRTDFLYDWLVQSPCNPRYSQESSQYHSSKASILQNCIHNIQFWNLVYTV